MFIYLSIYLPICLSIYQIYQMKLPIDTYIFYNYLSIIYLT